MPNLSELEKAVTKNITNLVISDKFKNWVKKVSLVKGEYVVINNSVLYRENSRTKKSTKYLALEIIDPSAFTYKIWIINFNRKINDFSIIPMKHSDFKSLVKIELKEAIERELTSLGRLIFLLIGDINDKEIFEQPIDHPLFNKLVLDSSIDSQLAIRGKEIIIKNILNSEVLWSLLESACKADSTIPNPLPDDFVGKFTTAINELQKISHVKLIIPNAGENFENSFLDQVVLSLQDNLREYKESLEACIDPIRDRNHYNNLLRISYTYSDEIVRFIKLFSSISDLKPIMFWLTAFEQFTFSFALENLPWERLGRKKQDLYDYVDTVKSARNKAFHNLLGFNQTIDVQLGNITIKPISLRLFTEHKSKDNIFDYEDKELIDILSEFTRAGESLVTFDFWKRNLIVMEHSLKLISEFSRSLKKINS